MAGRARYVTHSITRDRLYYRQKCRTLRKTPATPDGGDIGAGNGKMTARLFICYPLRPAWITDNRHLPDRVGGIIRQYTRYRSYATNSAMRENVKRHNVNIGVRNLNIPLLKIMGFEVRTELKVEINFRKNVRVAIWSLLVVKLEN